jgi:hypothetical protein
LRRGFLLRARGDRDGEGARKVAESRECASAVYPSEIDNNRKLNRDAGKLELQTKLASKLLI